MMRCNECGVRIEGTWTHCPLCRAGLVGHPSSDPLPSVPLRYSRRRLLQILFLCSLLLIGLSFGVQLWLGHRPAEFGAGRSIWMGVCTMWLVVLFAARKRRNLAKSTVYLVVLVGLVSTYWDYLTGWNRWSLTFEVPIVCGCAILALMITERAMRREVGDHVLYSGLTVLLGLVPIVFLMLGWVSTPLPSAICGTVALVALVLLQLDRGADMRHELAKRLHV